MDARQQCDPSSALTADKDEESPDEEQSDTPPLQPRPSLKKELVRLALQELALFQIHITVAVLWRDFYDFLDFGQNLVVFLHSILVVVLVPLLLLIVPIAVLLLTVPLAIILLKLPSITRPVVLPIVAVLLLVPLAALLLATLAIILLALLVSFGVLPLLFVYFQAFVATQWYMGMFNVFNLLGLSSFGLGLYKYNPHYHSSLAIIAITIPLLLFLDWRLMSAMDIRKEQMSASEEERRKVNKWNMLVRWVGHVFLVLASVYVVMECYLGTKNIHGYVYLITIQVFSGILAKMLLEVNKNEPDRILVSKLCQIKWLPLKWAIEWLAVKWFAIKETALKYLTFYWVPLKWIIVLEFAYLPSIGFLIWNRYYHNKYEGISLTVPLVKAIVLTVFTSDYKKLRQQRGAKDIIAGVAQTMLISILLHYIYNRSLAELVKGGLYGIMMWAAHFAMSKL